MPLAATRRDQEEGESGRKKNQYTRYGTVGLTAVQGYFIAVRPEISARAKGFRRPFDPACCSASPPSSDVGGTMFLMWLGE